MLLVKGRLSDCILLGIYTVHIFHCIAKKSQHFNLVQIFYSYLFKFEVACKNSSLAGVYTLAAIKKLWHEGRVEGIKVDRGHVVNSNSDFFLKKVMSFVEKDLEQHVDEMEEHRCPKKLLKQNMKTK